MTNQPDWTLVCATDYSALYTDSTGVYSPEFAIAQEFTSEHGTTRWSVYRFPCDRLVKIEHDDTEGGETRVYYVTETIARGYSAGTLPHPISSYREWFLQDLARVASLVGSTREDMLSDLCSDDPQRVASAYESIGGYHGFDNLDGYPSEWNEDEMRAWPERGKMRISLDWSDDDDGMINVTADCQDAARDDQSIEGSHWECPGDMDIGYASIMARPGLLADLEKEYEVDSSMYGCDADEEDYARWSAKLALENA